MAHVSINKYRQVSISNVQDMNPYDQVKLILVNIVGKLAAAKGCIERKDIEKKGLHISTCISLIGALQTALNMEEGGEISENLASLYEYCQFKLVNANVENDLEGISEVTTIIKNIKEGWDAIPQEIRQGGQEVAAG